VDELEKLDEILAAHPWANEIKWSFNYEMKKGHSIDFLYRKVVDTFEHHGPDPEYAYFLTAVEQLAASSDGIDEHEEAMINSVARDISKRLKTDFRRIELGM
jgi:hypothetical protein